MSELKPLDTLYKGYRFRSRLEARWAVFYDALGVKWMYEFEGFNLGNGLTYLPDFFLPDLNVWVEVKAKKPTQVEIDKACRLAISTNQHVYIFFGDIPYVDVQWLECEWDGAHIYFAQGGMDNHFHWCECPMCGKVDIKFSGYGDRICREKCNAPHNSYDATPRLRAAYEKARSARFEHGDRPM